MAAFVISFVLMLMGAVLASTATAQIVCDLCQELPPGWDGYVVTSQESSVDCRPAKGSLGAFKLPGVAGQWRQDARRVAAVAFGRLPAERANDPKAGAILEQVTVVLETETDAVVLARVGQTERRVCLVRAGPEEAWMVVRLDVADLSRPAPPAAEPIPKP
jgi:hypothetical protein